MYGDLERISEAGQLRDLGVKLVHLLTSKCRHFSAWCTSRISHPQNFSKFRQRETGGKRVSNEQDSVESF